MLTRDFVGGVASIAIGAVYLFFAYQLRTSALDDSMGPGGLPRVYGWLLVGLGAVLTIQALFAHRLATAGEAPEEKGEWEGQGRKIAFAAGLLEPFPRDFRSRAVLVAQPRARQQLAKSQIPCA